MSRDSHIYKRMDDSRIVKGYLKLLRESDIDTATKLHMRIKHEANDHPRFRDIDEAFRLRIEHNKD